MTLLDRTLPSVVAWDILFTEPSETSALDERFAAGIRASGASVMLGAMRADKDDGVELHQDTAAAAAESADACRGRSVAYSE